MSELQGGQKVRVLLACKDNPEERWSFTTRILWVSTIGDGLIQQGGVFLEVTRDEPNSPPPATV